MAEILFLICMSLLLLGSHVVVSGVLKKYYHFPFLMLLIGITANLIPGFIIPGTFLIAVSLAGIYLFFHTDKKFPFIQIAVLVLVMVAVMAYRYPEWSEILRKLYFGTIDRLIVRYPRMSRSRIIEALYSVWVYHEFIPGIIGIFSYSSIYAAWSKKDYPFTAWLRYTEDFSRHWIFPAMTLLLVAFISSQFKGGERLGIVLNNLSLAAAFPLMLLGFLILLFGLKRKKLSETVLLLLLYSIVVFSGPYFLFALALYFGVGASDSWMHYLKKA